MQTLYKILELSTVGWETVNRKLTRENCDQILRDYMADGKNPNNLRAVIDNESDT